MIGNAMNGLASALRGRVRPLWRTSLTLVLLALVALTLAGELGDAQGVLMMLPALLLAVVMLTRPYLGEATIARLRVRRAARRNRRVGVPGCALAPLRSPAHVSRGGCLIAMALAGRAPPLAPAGCPRS